MNNLFLTLFLIINALFWGLASHKQHCSLIPMKNCPPHWLHIGIGILCFLGAIYVEQKKYIDYISSS